jgi:hypothetical protein
MEPHDTERGGQKRAGEPPEGSVIPSKAASPFLGAAVGLWLVSLALPGFIVQGRTEVWNGGNILWLGLLFGWAVLGFAVYANLFFVPVAIRLFLGKRPTIAVGLMLVLAATLPFFRGVIADEGSGAVLPVVSWGWGAVLWIVAIVLLALAAAVRAGRAAATTARDLAILLAALDTANAARVKSLGDLLSR